MSDFARATSHVPTSIGRQTLTIIEDIEGAGFDYDFSHVEIDVLDAAGEVMETRQVRAAKLVQLGVITAAEVQGLKNLMQKIRTAAQSQIVEGT